MPYKMDVLGKWTVARLEGRIDGQTSPGLEAWALPLLDRDGINLALDLSQVGYVSSAGLRVFLKLLRECQARSGSFALVGSGPAVREVLDISGFSTLLTMRDSAAELPS